MEHHKFANDPDKDPDYPTHAPTALQAIWVAITARRPRGGQSDSYRKTLERLEQAGASAVVLPSLFEEQIEHEEQA